jgi:hypothetical protein
MDFRINPNADTNGTVFCGSIEDVTAEMMRRTIGDPVEDGYCDPWKGYTGNEWRFTSDDGQVVEVCDRKARKNWLSVHAHSHSIFEPFAAWLRNKVQKLQSNDQNSVQCGGSSRLLIGIAGVTFGNRQQTISRLSLREAIRFRRDPGNPYDHNAVRVETLNGEQIGFVPREQALSIAALLNLLGGTLVGWVNELKGGVPGYPNRGVVVGFEIADALVQQLSRYSHPPGNFYDAHWSDDRYDDGCSDDYDLWDPYIFGPDT